MILKYIEIQEKSQATYHNPCRNSLKKNVSNPSALVSAILSSSFVYTYLLNINVIVLVTSCKNCRFQFVGRLCMCLQRYGVVGIDFDSRKADIVQS